MKIIDMKIGELENVIDSCINRNEKICGMEARLNGVEGRMDSLEVRMDALEVRMDKLEARMDALEVRMDKLEAVVKDLVLESRRTNDLLDMLAGGIQRIEQELGMSFRRFDRHDDQLENHEERITILEI